MNDQAVTPILSILLLLPTVAVGTVAVMQAWNQYQDAHQEYMQAKTEQFQKLAECARDPEAYNEWCPLEDEPHNDLIDTTR